MKIYSDSELPDIELELFVQDCPANTMVSITIDGIDDPSVQRQLDAPCGDTSVTFEDVARQRYKLVGSVVDDAGEERNHAEEELDLRNGLDEHADLYFPPFANFRVAWEFEGGATCGSLGVFSVELQFLIDGERQYTHETYCQASRVLGNAPDGVYSVIARGYGSDDAPIVASRILSAVTIDSATIVNLGTFVLAPCGAQCP
jgi:hypothetical protein